MAKTIHHHDRRDDDDQWHRQGEQPAGHEQLFAADPIGEASGEQVGERLDDAERDDEGGGGTGGCQPELLVGQKWQDSALQPDHRADEGVDEHEQPELPPVGAQAQLDWLGRCRGHLLQHRAAVGAGLNVGQVAVGKLTGFIGVDDDLVIRRGRRDAAEDRRYETRLALVEQRYPLADIG